MAEENQILDQKKYDETFPSFKRSINGPEALKEKALEHALDIRKFEIDLYWKRATYFWAFIAAAFAGYLAMISAEKPASPDMFVMLSSLGLSFSVAWYFVNRGSKFWQNNWERHVDLLENEIIGPLYKTAIDIRTCYFRRLHKEYPFSVSKVNQILSLYMIAIWTFLTIKSISMDFSLKEPFHGFNSVSLVIITGLFFWFLFKYAKTEQISTKKDVDRNEKRLIIRKSFFE